MKYTISLGLVLFVVVMLAIWMLKQGHWWGDDFALYIHQARALNEHSVDMLIETNRFAIEHSTLKGFSPTLAPWGFPVLLAPAMYIFGLNIEAFKVLIIVFYIAFLAVYFFTFRKMLPKPLLLVAVLLLGANVNYLAMINNVQTEIPYLLFACLSLWGIHHFLERPEPWKGIMLGALIWFTFQIRTEGVLWLPALLAGQAGVFIKSGGLKQERKAIAATAWRYGVPFVTFIVILLAGSYLLPNGFTDHADRVLLPDPAAVKAGIIQYFSRFANILAGVEASWARFLLMVFFLFGLVYRFKKDLPAATYTLLALCLFIAWPYREYRYALLLYPFICYFMVQGCAKLFSWILPERFGTVATISILLICSVKNFRYLYYEVRYKETQFAAGPETADSREMFAFIRDHTKINDTVLFFRPRAMALYTRRKSAMVFDNWPKIAEEGNFYVMDKDPNTICQLKPDHPYMETDDFRTNFSKVFENEEFVVYSINR